MLTRIYTLLLFLVTTFVVAQQPFVYQRDFKTILEKTKTKKDPLNYETLLKRFTKNDTTLTDKEVLALLIGFTDNKHYKPYEDIETEREIYNLNGEKKYDEALRLANKFLKTHPLSVKAIFEKSYLFHQTDKKDSALYYLWQGRKIFFAMYYSGDGKTPETPTFALGPADGQDYIYKFVGAGIGTMGSARDKDGNFLDVLDAQFENGGTMKLYFIIQHATDKMFSSKEMKEFEKELKKIEKEEKKKKEKEDKKE